MANHKSAAKRARQSLKKSARNLSTKKAVRTSEKKLRVAIEAKDMDQVPALFKTFSSKIGKAAQKGIYHSKTASRKIGRIASAIHQLSK